MKDENYSSDVEYETDSGGKNKFTLTRGVIILIAIVAIVFIAFIVILLGKSAKKEKYTQKDFNRLELRMEEEAPNYVLQKQIVLDDNEIRINLKDLIAEGAIDPKDLVAAKICDGYVVRSKKESEAYKAYINCVKGSTKYTTTGYASNNTTKKTTTKKDSVDKTKPVITIIGDSEITINRGTAFKDPFVTAIDDVDGDITSTVQTIGEVDTSKVGTYKITYSVQDIAGNKAITERIIKVVEGPTTTTTITTTSRAIVTTRKPNTTVKIETTTKKCTPPTIKLNGSSTQTISQGQAYSDKGYYASDCYQKDITSKVQISGNVNVTKTGTYYLTYSVTDDYGNRVSVTRKVIVKNNYVQLKSISVTPNSMTLSKKQTKKITVLYTPTNATNKSITWTSNNPAVATISNGTVTAVSKGEATITAASSNGLYARTKVIVK